MSGQSADDLAGSLVCELPCSPPVSTSDPACRPILCRPLQSRALYRRALRSLLRGPDWPSPIVRVKARESFRKPGSASDAPLQALRLCYRTKRTTAIALAFCEL